MINPEPKATPEQIVIQYGPHKGIYNVHPVAQLFPLLQGQAYKELVDSIREIGQQEPVVLDGPDLLDGRNRVAVLNDLGNEPLVVQFADLQTGLNPGVWIAAKNLERRHLTNDQILALTARYRDWCEAVTQTQKIADACDVESRKTASDDGNAATADNLTANDDYPQKPADTPTPGKRGRPRGQRSKAEALAADTKQSRYRAEQILKVRSHSPELAVAVEQGRMPLKDAAAQVPTSIPNPNQAEGTSEKPVRPPDTAKVERVAERATDKSREFAERLRRSEKPLFWQQIIARAQVMFRFESPESYAGRVEHTDASSVSPVKELEEQ